MRSLLFVPADSAIKRIIGEWLQTEARFLV